MSAEYSQEGKKWTKEGVIFVLIRDGKVLLQVRPETDEAFGGFTIIPGGKCEAGETLPETLKREIKEETSFEGTMDIVSLGSFIHIVSSGNKHLSHVFLITNFQGEVVNNEPEKGEHLWVPIEKAFSLLELGISKYTLLLAQIKLNEAKLRKD